MSESGDEEKYVWNIDFTVRGTEAMNFALAHARVFGGDGDQVLSPEALKKKGQEKFIKALDGISFAAPKAVENKPSFMVLGEKETKLEGLVHRIADSDTLLKVQEMITSDLATALIAFLSTKGTFSTERYWLLASDKTFEFNGDVCWLYVSFPELVTGGDKSAIIIGYAEDVGKFIGSGGETAMLNYFKRVGIKVNPQVKRYAFPKGMHVVGFPVARMAEFKEDVNLAMKWMKGPITKNKLTEEEKSQFTFFPVKTKNKP